MLRRPLWFVVAAEFLAAIGDHFFFLPLRLLPAFARAIAIACFCGLPAFISALMLADTTSLDLPFLSGMTPFSNCDQCTAICRSPTFIGVDRRHPCIVYKRLDWVAVDMEDATVTKMPEARQVHIVCGAALMLPLRHHHELTLRWRYAGRTYRQDG